MDEPRPVAAGQDTAVFAGGCFWGTQAVLERVKGVIKTTAGYAGGSASTATYKQVITESVEVVYDPSRITYGQLLRIFFSVGHDPTELNRQGPDVGTSYRSAILDVTENSEFALYNPCMACSFTPSPCSSVLGRMLFDSCSLAHAQVLP